MKNSRRIALLLSVVLFLALCSACASEKVSAGISASAGETVLRLKAHEFTEGEILAMMDLTCRSYGMTLDDVREDPKIWNSLVDGTVYDYAAAEISRDLCSAYGLLDMSAYEKSYSKQYKSAFLSKIGKIGEDKDEYLAKLGLTDELLTAYAEDQVYKGHLSKYWREQMESISEDEKKAEYEELLNFTKRIWEEIDVRIESGEYSINEGSLLLNEN